MPEGTPKGDGQNGNYLALFDAVQKKMHLLGGIFLLEREN